MNASPAVVEHRPADARLTEVLDWMTADIARIRDDLGWAYAAAYYCPASPTIDETLRPASRVVATRTRPDGTPDPDFESGAVLDFGIGNHAARTAFHETGPRLAAVERDLDLASRALLVGLVDLIPHVYGPDDGATWELLKVVLAGLSWRVDHFPLALTCVPARDDAIKAARPMILSAAKGLERCVGGLGRALNRGPLGATGVPKCRICGIRALNPNRRGPRCDTCRVWKERNKEERPRSVDANLNEPIQAQRRRMERGEGWGVA